MVMMFNVNDQEYREIHQFLHQEAFFLDERHWEGWLEMLSKNIRYYAPYRAFYDRLEGRSYGNSAYFDDTYDSIKIRVEQQRVPQNTIAENPYTITRRFIANIIPSKIEEGLYAVLSNILVFRTRATEQSTPFILSARREDKLQRENQQLKLAERAIYIDEPVLRSPNISFFL